MEPFLVSLFYFAFVVLICEIGRSLNSAFVQDQAAQRLIEEFFGTMQVCAALYENGFVLTEYGFIGFALAVFGTYILHGYTVRRAVVNASPLIERFLVGSNRAEDFVSQLACQLAGAFLSFRLARMFWSFQMTDLHRHAYIDYQCSSDLQVGLLTGILCEMLAAFLFRFSSLKFNKHFPHYALFFEGALITTIVLTGLNYTGMYFNPILATSAKYGCHQVRISDLLFVYWLGPVLGWLLANRVHSATD